MQYLTRKPKNRPGGSTGGEKEKLKTEITPLLLENFISVEGKLYLILIRVFNLIVIKTILSYQRLLQGKKKTGLSKYTIV